MGDWENEIERSGSGDPIHRYEPGSRDFEFASGDPTLITAIERHIDEHIGSCESVFHEIFSDCIHVDVHIVAPRHDRPFYTLVTSGMAERPMQQPDGVEGCQFAELTLSLPPDWPGLSPENGAIVEGDDSPLKDERFYWPIRTLKFLARFPHLHNTWIWQGHSIPNGDPPEPLASDTQLCGWVLMPSQFGGEDFEVLRVGDRDIHFFSPWPIYAEEMQFKLDHGMDALLDRFQKIKLKPIPELVSPQRLNACAPRSARRWWPFSK